MINIRKNQLLLSMDEPEVFDDLIRKIHDIKNLNIMRVKNMDFEQTKKFLVRQKSNCIVLLGIEQRKGKAIDLLYQIHNFSDNAPYIIVVTKMKIAKLLEHIEAHSVSKLFHVESKNYSNESVIDWIEKVYHILDMSTVFPFPYSYSTSAIKRNISIRLQLMGLLVNLTGHKYVVDAIEMYMKNPNIYVTKEIYWILAGRYNTTYANVDRCMRHVIEVAWRDTKIDTLEKYYPDTARVYQNRPSVSEFIRCVANDILDKSKEQIFNNANNVTSE